MICKQLEVAEYLGLFYFQVSGLVFVLCGGGGRGGGGRFVPFFQTRTANPVIGFLPGTEYTLIGCQGVEGVEGRLLPLLHTHTRLL